MPAKRRDENPRIDLFLIDEVINDNDPVLQKHGTLKYYDPGHDVTVVTDPDTGDIVTLHADP